MTSQLIRAHRCLGYDSPVRSSVLNRKPNRGRNLAKENVKNARIFIGTLHLVSLATVCFKFLPPTPNHFFIYIYILSLLNKWRVSKQIGSRFVYILPCIPALFVTLLIQTARHKNQHSRSCFRDFRTSTLNKTRNPCGLNFIDLVPFLPIGAMLRWFGSHLILLSLYYWLDPSRTGFVDRTTCTRS